MQPNYPIYIPSKGRADSRFTSKALSFMRIPHYIVVEEQEYDMYVEATKGSTATILILDHAYKENYELCDEHGLTRSTGPGPARNFAWDHSISQGHKWHWVCDDNIRYFHRLNRNSKIKLADGTGFRCMEEFVERYENVGMAGPNYSFFCPAQEKRPPYIINTRIYSCNLIRNDLPYRWRGRYNEDTILSLDMLENGWCTVQFNAFLQAKMQTQQLGGGNTGEFYSNEGTIRKSKMLYDVYPHVTTLVWKFGREHHSVDYNRYKFMNLKRRKDLILPSGNDEHGLQIKYIPESYPGRV